MINFLNEILRELFVSRIKDDIADSSQVSFELPDEEFRSQVKTLGQNVLNLSLVDLRENRTLGKMMPKSWAPTAEERPDQRRVDCHYLISAWSPAARSVEPCMDEHALLYKALAALMEAEPLAARKIYGSRPLPTNFPRMLRSAELPIVILPVERFPKIAEFWAAAQGIRWKPTIHLVVTLPVLSDQAANAGVPSSPDSQISSSEKKFN
jgi:hypothetical protein